LSDRCHCSAFRTLAILGRDEYSEREKRCVTTPLLSIAEMIGCGRPPYEVFKFIMLTARIATAPGFARAVNPSH